MTSPSEPLKHCKGCDKDKSLDAFALAAHHKDGRQSRCRLCCQQDARNRYKAVKPEDRRSYTWPRRKEKP